MLIITHHGTGGFDTETIERTVGVLRAQGREPVRLCHCDQSSDLDQALDQPDGETVVAMGGDGSIHRLVAALHVRGELRRRVVGLLPFGTGNDLARNLGIPLDPLRAARLILDGRPRELDLLVDDGGGVVLNAVHVGAGAAAAIYARRFKPYLRVAAFPLGAILAGARTAGWRLRVEADGRLVTEDKLIMVSLSNNSGIAGGSAQLAPGAVPDDGRLELVTSAATGPIARVRYALSLRDGTHRHRDDVLHRVATSVTVSGEEFLTNSDGEVAGPFTKRTWRLLPNAWRLIAPAG
jgi:diacylglycerol kinase family enzyme